MNNTISINLVNKTNLTFYFNKIIVNNPENKLSLNKQVILPDQTCIITGMTHETDLSGTIYFNDDNRFDILDPLQYHDKQPIFEMNGRHFFSTIITQIFNPDIEPKLLLITEATIVLKNK